MVPGPFNAIRVRAPAPDRISTVPGVNRRGFLGLAASALKGAPRKPRVACVMNVWFPDSHADVFVSRLLDGYRLDHEWHAPRLSAVSFYVDQFPANDMAREE